MVWSKLVRLINGRLGATNREPIPGYNDGAVKMLKWVRHFHKLLRHSEERNKLGLYRVGL